MIVLSWLRKYWYLPVFAIFIVLAWVIGRRSAGNPFETVRREVDAINAGAEIRKLEAERGTAQAKAEVEAKYKAQLAALSEEQKQQAAELAASPVDLAKFLVRAGGGSV